MKISRDTNGNKILKIEASDLNGARGFSVQTLGNLPKTHLDGIFSGTRDELVSFINEHGTDRQKQLISGIDTKADKAFYNDPTSKLLLESIDLEYLELPESASIDDKLKAAKACFYSELGFRVKQTSQKEAIKDWLQGLCSAVSVPFYNCDIVQWGLDSGVLDLSKCKRDSTKDSAKIDFIERYWDCLAGRLSVIFNRH